MSDLVKRLRKRKEFGLNGQTWIMLTVQDADCKEAADRIEALEAALREIGDPLMPHRVDGVGRAWEQATIQAMQKIARAALAEEQDK